MKACIYARKSTSKLGQNETIQNQIKICKSKAKELKLDVVDIKQDTGTGTDDLSRPEVKQLIQDAKNGKYECVIMKGISRLYRDTEKGLGLIKLLDRYNIRVVTVEEMFDSKLDRNSNGKLDTSKITIYLMFAEMESKKLGERIKHTQIEKARSGEWNQVNNVPFGYKYNPETKKLEIDYATSEVVKLIFDLYVNGMGMRQVMHFLNGDNPEGKKYPSPKNSIWSQYTIGYILKNEVYVGHVVFNKRSKKERAYKQPEVLGKSEDDVYVGNDLNDPDMWIIAKNAHEPIIDGETFQKVQEMAATKASRKGIRNNVSLLTGIAKCGECGSSMTFKRGRKNSKGWVVTKDNYYCMKYIKYGKNFCSSHHIGADDLESMVIENLLSFTTNDDLLKKVIKKVNSQTPQKTADHQKKKASIQNQIHSVVEKMDKLLEKNLNGDITDQVYKVMNSKFSDELSSLTASLESIESQIASSNEAQSNELFFRKKLKEFKDVENKSKEELRYLLLDLVSTVVVDKELYVDIEYKF